MENETTTALAINPTQLLSQAIDKGLGLEQLEKLMDLQERWEKKEAEKKYNHAMSCVQKDIQVVQAKLHNRQTGSKYAGIIDIDAVIRPQYTSHGLAISFDTADSPLSEHVRVMAFVTHEAGHKETRHIDIPADGKGAKGGDVMTKTHAVMSATTYGQRALLKMIFNIASGEFDDDGNKAAKKPNNLPFPNKNQWGKILEKFKTGEISTDQIEKNFKLSDPQKKELEKIINSK